MNDHNDVNIDSNMETMNDEDLLQDTERVYQSPQNRIQEIQSHLDQLDMIYSMQVYQNHLQRMQLLEAQINLLNLARITGADISHIPSSEIIQPIAIADSSGVAETLEIPRQYFHRIPIEESESSDNEVETRETTEK